MNVKQVYELVNAATKASIGETAVLNEDLTNVVDVGEEIFNAGAVDNYVKALVDHIGKVVFVNRPYSGGVPSILMDGWEFGSVLEKVQVDIPEASENETWELVDGQSYDPNIFYKPSVSVKFFNSKVTFELDQSIAQRQVRESFSSASQLNGFVSSLENAVDKSMTIKMDALVMRTINNMIAETVYDEYNTADYDGSSGVRAVNLLYLYNENKEAGEKLTADDAVTNPDFIRFAAFTMDKYMARLARASSMFNVGGKVRFTPRDLLHIVMLSDFQSAARVYLQSDTFHKELVALPNAETVPYWQGSGTDYGFDSISSIDVKSSAGHTVKMSGILGIMFDRDALGVCNLDRRTTGNFNPKGEFYNYFYKFDAGYFNDLNENFVVFFVA